VANRECKVDPLATQNYGMRKKSAAEVELALFCDAQLDLTFSTLAAKLLGMMR
jgi:hypothetical protein